MARQSKDSRAPELDAGITAIIVTYRRPELLRQILLQLINQVKLPKTIIVVDNDVERSAEKIVKQLSLECKKVQIIYLINRENSLSVGRNFGVSQSETKFTCMLDDDVLIPQNYLQGCLMEIEKLPGAAGVQGVLNLEKKNILKNFVSFATGNFYFSRSTPHVRWSISASYPKYRHKLRPLPSRWMSGTNQFYRTEILKEIKWDENLIKYCDGEDLDHSLRVSQSGLGSIHMIPHIKVEHLEAPEARVIGFKNILMRETYAYYFLHKLFRGNRIAKIFYAWSRLSSLLVLFIQVSFSMLSGADTQVLRDNLKVIGIVIKYRKEIREGNLKHVNSLL